MAGLLNSRLKESGNFLILLITGEGRGGEGRAGEGGGTVDGRSEIFNNENDSV